MIAIIDYGAGNIFSVKNALDFLGIDGILTADPKEIEAADAIILPGVGAFPKAMEMLQQDGLDQVISREAHKKPFLGICLGMQLLFEESFEFSPCKGLGLIPGTVEKMEPDGLVIPHMGWNRLEMKQPCPILEGLSDPAYVYFVHSYMAKTSPEYPAATVTYGELEIPAMVFDGKTVYGAQFHPEKSGAIGLEILRKFCALTTGGVI